ncbi:MAG: 4-hydroxy-tetrahydrodipicolinate reductase [Pseudomonadota bacterium]
MTDTLSIAVAGAAGRMGRQIIAAASTRRHTVTGGSEQAESSDFATDLGVLAGLPPLGRFPTQAVADAAADADTWIDFTRPSATLGALEALRSTSVKTVIIGTTGFLDEEEDALAQHQHRYSIVKAGNFSLGVALLSALTRMAAEKLGEDWDIDILEAHHRHKVDAPSGTALMLGDAAATGRGQSLQDVRLSPYDGADAKRQPGKIGFASSRTGDIVGEHEVRFGSETELVKLSHTALNRRVFAEGAIKAAEWASMQSPGLYGIHDVLGLA